MGVSQDDVDAIEVIIKTPTRQLIFESPSVQKIVMQGQTSFQIVGGYREEDIAVDISISDEDIRMVSEQSGVSASAARAALEETRGDIAEAIVNLQSKNG